MFVEYTRMIFVKVIIISIISWGVHGTNSGKKCIVTEPDKEGSGWGVKIMSSCEQVSHGTLVTPTRVLTDYSTFHFGPKEMFLVPRFSFVVYGNDNSQKLCRQFRKPTRFFGPPEKTRKGQKHVLDLAFWEMDKPFEVAAEIPLPFANSKDVSKQISIPSNGKKCSVQWFNNALSDDLLDNKLTHLNVTVTELSGCKEFCKDGACHLKTQYICVSYEKGSIGDSERGALLICHNAPIGILKTVGRRTSRNRILFTALLAAWEVYEEQFEKRSIFRVKRDENQTSSTNNPTSKQPVDTTDQTSNQTVNANQTSSRTENPGTQPSDRADDSAAALPDSDLDVTVGDGAIQVRGASLCLSSLLLPSAAVLNSFL